MGNKFIQKIWQISFHNLSEETLKKIRNGHSDIESLTYYKKDIGEEDPVGYFIVASVDCLYSAELPTDLKVLIAAAIAHDVYYIEIDEMFETDISMPIFLY